MYIDLVIKINPTMRSHTAVEKDLATDKERLWEQCDASPTVLTTLSPDCCHFKNLLSMFLKNGEQKKVTILQNLAKRTPHADPQPFLTI